jgi:hypothetical protein
MRTERLDACIKFSHKILPLQFCVAQWRILIWRSGLVEGYTMWHCTIVLDLTSRAGFASGVIII